MKYIKAYEKYSEKPQIGDYIIAEAPDKWKDKLKKDQTITLTFDFLSNNIGKLVNIVTYQRDTDKEVTNYVIEYENVPKDILPIFNKNLLEVNLNLIKYWGDKEDLKVFIDAKKYNL